jgi:ABC-2 type transport system permease protein
MRLLRPIHPLWSYAVENLAALPMRLLVALPVAVIMLATTGASRLSQDPVIWAIWCPAMLGAWLVTFLANLIVGCLSLYMESSLKLMDVWIAIFFVFSGYLFPLELFPPALRTLADWLPFRYQIGFPVELMIGAHGREEALWILLRQWAFVALMLGLVSSIWRRGLRRFAAYGG